MREDTQKHYEERVRRVVETIVGGLDRDLSLDALAQVACFSPYHFHRIFRGLVGESVREFVRRLRLERAARALRNEPTPIHELARAAGYESHEAFTRAFRAAFGRTPSDHRELATCPTWPTCPSGVHYREDGRCVGLRLIAPEGVRMDITIRELPERSVAFLHHVGPYDKVGDTWMQLMRWAGMQGLLGPRTESIGVCYDDPAVVAADELRYDACVTIAAPLTDTSHVQEKTLPAGRYATAIHVGPYEGLAEFYNRLIGQELPGQGLEIRNAPCLESYLDNPQETKPEALRTEVFVPVA